MFQENTPKRIYQNNDFYQQIIHLRNDQHTDNSLRDMSRDRNISRKKILFSFTVLSLARLLRIVVKNLRVRWRGISKLQVLHTVEVRTQLLVVVDLRSDEFYRIKIRKIFRKLIGYLQLFLVNGDSGRVS